MVKKNRTYYLLNVVDNFKSFFECSKTKTAKVSQIHAQSLERFKHKKFMRMGGSKFKVYI